MNRQAIIVALLVGLFTLAASEGSEHARMERGLFGGKKTTTAKPKLSTDRFGRVDVREMTTKKPGLFSKLAGKLG
ncbi:hypothetical protein AAVH_08633 [Aphelenchoides avenae]|nr:hypothetical protein AAVH_08633 [Aphelenchus avenae]